MKFLPVALNVQGKRCLIVGGGAVARRKAESLLECGAKVRVIAPQLCDEFEALLEVVSVVHSPSPPARRAPASQGEGSQLSSPLGGGRVGAAPASLEYSGRAFTSGDCNGHTLVFACTDSRELNAAIAKEARSLGIWCNVADDADASDFHVAAAVHRGDICVGITTGGGSPALSRHLKSKVQEAIGPEYSELLEIMSARRDALSRSTPGQKQRAVIWRAILESAALELLRSGRREAAEAVIDGLCHPSHEK